MTTCDKDKINGVMIPFKDPPSWYQSISVGDCTFGGITAADFSGINANFGSLTPTILAGAGGESIIFTYNYWMFATIGLGVVLVIMILKYLGFF